jgi:mannose-6-phosphate isomerase-like protein (cupin superfamily)
MALVVHPDEVEPRGKTGADVRVTFGPHNGCEQLEQRVIRFPPGRFEGPQLEDRQAVLFVAAGRGELELDGQRHPLEPDTGALVKAGEAFAVLNPGPDDLVVVSVRAAEDRELARADRKVTVRYADRPDLDASKERRFRYLVNEEAGCFDVTQFVGVVQPSKAPPHSHPYDEVGYVIEGEGIAHIEGEEWPLRTGSCFHLPPREIHTIENSGTGPMRILGVFHPSGNPADHMVEHNK